jgi:uncharacterized protein
LLLHLPAATFEAIVPVLIGVAVVLVAVQPMVQRRLPVRGTPTWRRLSGAGGWPPSSPARTPSGPTGFTSGVYFAASQGVLQIGIFGLLLRESLQRLNALKNVLTLTVNTVAAGAYVVVATDRVDWWAAGLLAVGSLVGGAVSSRYGRRLPSAVLRTAIVVLGVVAIVVLVNR